MARPKKEHALENEDVISKTLEAAKEEKLPIEEMPLESLRDYRLYNEEARKLNKKLRMCRYPIKQCPVELHPKQRIKFGNNDKSVHPVKIFLSNHLIHYDEKWIPGHVYDAPECVIHYLSEKGYPVWGWVNLADGSKETRQVAKSNRFSLTPVYDEIKY